MVSCKLLMQLRVLKSLLLSVASPSLTSTIIKSILIRCGPRCTSQDLPCYWSSSPLRWSALAVAFSSLHLTIHMHFCCNNLTCTKEKNICDGGLLSDQKESFFHYRTTVAWRKWAICGWGGEAYTTASHEVMTLLKADISTNGKPVEHAHI